MKKWIVFLWALLIFPASVLAYSNEVILGGNTIGININTKGVMVIGFYKVNNKYIKTDLKEGDIITKVENEEISSINDLTKAIESNIKNNRVNITYERNNKINTANILLIKENNTYKTGLYVKDSIIGIGTLVFIDPESKIYCALGHEVEESHTNKIIEVKTGTIFKNSITNIEKSTNGIPGSKNAKFYYDDIYGDIKKNTKYGIYGNYKNNFDKKELISIANKEEVKIGNATIRTVLEDEKIEEFAIIITNINEHSDTKNISFKITDQRLLDKTGGIVQGMSGSPIIQDNKLVGAVTHVITDNVTTGYGLFITTMLEESER